MTANSKSTIRFLLGVACIIAAVLGAFWKLPPVYFIVIFAGGCGLAGERTIWEKVASIVKGTKQ